MRSRVMPGSSPTMERRVPVSRLNNVDLPTLGRPTIATSGSARAADEAGITDRRYVGKESPFGPMHAALSIVNEGIERALPCDSQDPPAAASHPRNSS